MTIYNWWFKHRDHKLIYTACTRATDLAYEWFLNYTERSEKEALLNSYQQWHIESDKAQDQRASRDIDEKNYIAID